MTAPIPAPILTLLIKIGGDLTVSAKHTENVPTNIPATSPYILFIIK